MSSAPPSPAEKPRLDVWLWRARLFKTRSEAAAAVANGAVRLARAGRSRTVDKAGFHVCLGDGLTVKRITQWITVEVLAFGVRRGPPAEARLLYRSLDQTDNDADTDRDDAQP